jgi:hypothetical protein
VHKSSTGVHLHEVFEVSSKPQVAKTAHLSKRVAYVPGKPTAQLGSKSSTGGHQFCPSRL